MQVLGYVRLSKAEENSVSIDMQKTQIVSYCERNGFTLGGIEEDNGISGSTLSRRPGVQRLLVAISSRRINAIVVYRSDRLTRNGRDNLMLEDMMQASGIRYLSVTEGDLSGNSIDDRFMAYIRSGLVERERLLISARTKAALQRKREKGEKIGGQTPYGFTAIDGLLVACDDETSLVSHVRHLRKQGRSLRQITRDLSEAGVTTRKGTPIGKTQVERILKAS